MKLFCTDEEWTGARKWDRQLSLAFKVLAGLTLAVFVVLCLLVRTRNAATMHGVILGCTTLLGWACILVWVLGARPARRRLRHMDMLRQVQPENVTGTLTVTKESFQIPKGIRIRRIQLQDGDETIRLSVNEEWVGRMPEDGAYVRAATVHSYLAGIETIREAPGRLGGADRARSFQLRKWHSRFLTLLPLMLLWTFGTVIFGSFVFYRITDTDPGHKIAVFMDGVIANEAELADRLEKELPAPIRMVKIHPFSYVMFGSEELINADIYIVPASRAADYQEWYTALPEEMRETGSLLELENGVAGILVFDPETGNGAAEDCFRYGEGEPEKEAYYLFFGKNSIHLSPEDGGDRSAAAAAKLILGD